MWESNFRMPILARTFACADVKTLHTTMAAVQVAIGGFSITQ